jgi:signal transduction histidine kinase
VHNPRVTELTEGLNALVLKNKSFDEFELVYNFKLLGERTLLINAKRIKLGSFTTDFLLLGIQDITQRKIIEQQKDDFVGYVTHELKTPITTVVAFVQILQGYHEKTGDKKSQFLLEKINGQMQRLTSLLNSFANVYKAQTGILELTKYRFDFNKVVHDVVESFQYMSSSHNLIVVGNLSRQIYGDRERIYEVLVNLIMNAIKYSPNADKVIINMNESPDEITISVQDFGVGIAHEEQQKVFERFFRVKGKMKYKIEGLGLGLYLAASIIKGHKGKLWVESTEGKGSTFFFSLPVKH